MTTRLQGLHHARNLKPALHVEQGHVVGIRPVGARAVLHAVPQGPVGILELALDQPFQIGPRAFRRTGAGQIGKPDRRTDLRGRKSFSTGQPGNKCIRHGHPR